MRCLGKRSMAAKPKTIRSRHKNLRSGAVVGGSPRPTALPPPCGRRGSCAGAGCLGGVHGPRGGPTCTRRTARIPGPPLGRRAPPQRPAPAVPQRVARARALLDHADQRRRAVARSIGQTAQPHTAPTRSLRRPVPGRGARRRVLRRSALHDLPRVPREHALVSSWRRGHCAKASAGKRDGTAGTQSGNAALPWACAAAAGRCLRHHPLGQHSLPRWENTPRQGQACTVCAPQWARAVYDLRPRHPACAMQPLRHG
jgi:hypothetical protein